MKKILSLITILVLSTFSFVKAEDAISTIYLGGGADSSVNVITNLKQEGLIETNSSAKSSIEVKTNTSTENKADAGVSAKNETNAIDSNEKGMLESRTHQSVVAKFVQNLMDVSKKQWKMGADIKVIAQEQNDDLDVTIKAIEKIETRGELKTFLVGTDYKNIGTLRSQIAKSESRMAKLEALISKASTTVDKTILTTELASLKEAEVKLEAFVKLNEDKFSVFGWLSKILNK